jgi:phenylalanyl-tRNA synthetase beta chain
VRVPYSWLMEYLEADIAADELARVLTMGGLEVEEIRQWTSSDGKARDQILVTKVTANRGDMLCLSGVARQAAALLQTTFRLPDFPWAVIANPVVGETEVRASGVTVELADPAGCPRYSALLMEGLTPGPSPDWLAYRLEAAGMRPLSRVVDCTNYVMLELGQPLHAFDWNLLTDGHIIVRRAQAGEKMITLDRQSRQLTPDDLLITDPVRPVALAGIMGGADSEMNESSTKVLLESAHFDPTSVRKTALRLGLSSEASYRFERNVDPAGTLQALARVSQLISETAGGKVVGPALDACAADFSPRPTTLRPARCNQILGTDLPASEMVRCLQAIDFTVQQEGEVLQVGIPRRRWDVEREIDLIEEVAIIYGYENLPMTVPGRLHRSGLLSRRQRFERQAGAILRQCGLSETLSFSVTSPAELDRLGLPAEAPQRQMLALSNPMIDTQTHLRTTLLPAMLEAAEANVRQRVTEVGLYEINKVFLPQPDSLLPDEPQRVAGVVMGTQLTADWNLPTEASEPDFYLIKGIVEQLCSGLGVQGVEFVRTAHPAFHPGRCAALRVAGCEAGVLGEVAEAVQVSYDLPTRTYAFELNLEALYEAACESKQYQALPRYPAVLRDLGLLLTDDDDHTADRVGACIKAAGGDILWRVQPFDLFKDAQRLGEGIKNLAFRLEFRTENRTLTDEEVENAMSIIKSAVSEQLGARVRDY